MTIVEFADTLAEKAHRGQTRWDKSTPYITHPRAVAKLARGIAEKYHPTWSLSRLEEIETIALTHDCGEDTQVDEKQIIIELSKAAYGADHDLKRIYDALMALNKNNYSDYLAFTLAAKANESARIVKMADITHNLSESKKTGSMVDKYLLALHILA